MNRITHSVCLTLFVTGGLLAETKVNLESLPSSLQLAIKEHAKGATITAISKEKEKGKTLYEVESNINGKSRDLMIDSAGKLVSVEEETTLDSLPAPAREAIQKKVAGGQMKKVEVVTAGSITSYEVAYTAKDGKSKEYAVNADGTPHKE